IFFMGLFRNLRLSLSIGSAYSMLAITYSGLTFPVFGMSPIAQAMSYAFPYTYWLNIFMGQSLRGEPISNIIHPMYSLIAFIIFGILFIPRLKYLLLNKKYWGKI
ncbi:MAG: ABC transporter permease, partial [Bacteroidota bacterium]|nr:ABC transporter permease [Bacteroidota bacterium]